MSDILVVEDNPGVQFLVERILAMGGHHVDSAGNGLRALQKLAQSAPDLIVSDMDMPRCDGLQMCRELRCTPGLEYIPVVIITALDDDDQRVRRVAQLDHVSFLSKPFTPKALLDVVATVLHTSPRRVITPKLVPTASVWRARQA